METKNHHKRLAAILAVVVVALFAVALGQFFESGETQQASTIRAIGISD